MKNQSKLGRPVRLGLISAGMPEGFDPQVRRTHSLAPLKVASIDSNATIALEAVNVRAQDWTVFVVCVGEDLLEGDRYFLAARWLLDAGVDAILCLSALKEQEMRISGANQHARRLGIPLIVAESTEHTSRDAWASDVVLASADPALASDEAVWATAPERCRVGGRSHASAAGVVAGVAMSELGHALPRGELMDSLRAWTLLPESRLAS